MLIALAAQHSFLRKGVLAAQGFGVGSPGSSLQYSQPPPLTAADSLEIVPLDLSTPSVPLGSSLDSKSSLSSFVTGTSLPSSLASFYAQVEIPSLIHVSSCNKYLKLSKTIFSSPTILHLSIAYIPRSSLRNRAEGAQPVATRQACSLSLRHCIGCSIKSPAHLWK